MLHYGQVSRGSGWIPRRCTSEAGMNAMARTLRAGVMLITSACHQQPRPQSDATASYVAAQLRAKLGPRRKGPQRSRASGACQCRHACGAHLLATQPVTGSPGGRRSLLPGRRQGWACHGRRPSTLIPSAGYHTFCSIYGPLIRSTSRCDQVMVLTKVTSSRRTTR